jgi:hypothetical protein
VFRQDIVYTVVCNDFAIVGVVVFGVIVVVVHVLVEPTFWDIDLITTAIRDRMIVCDTVVVIGGGADAFAFTVNCLADRGRRHGLSQRRVGPQHGQADDEFSGALVERGAAVVFQHGVRQVDVELVLGRLVADQP